MNFFLCKVLSSKYYKGSTYDGITGHQSFDANGDTNLKIISIYKLGLNEQNMPDWLYEAVVNVR